MRILIYKDEATAMRGSREKLFASYFAGYWMPDGRFNIVKDKFFDMSGNNTINEGELVDYLDKIQHFYGGKKIMKAWIQTTPDFDYDVIDVYLVLQSGKQLFQLKGFDDVEWAEAVQFAQEVAAELGLEYIGEAGEANHELDWIESE